jgi:hypothetical protein
MVNDCGSVWPRYGSPTNGVEATSSAAARRMIEAYRHYLKTQLEQYPRNA